MTCQVIVPNGITLTIEAGVTVVAATTAASTLCSNSCGYANDGSCGASMDSNLPLPKPKSC